MANRPMGIGKGVPKPKRNYRIGSWLPKKEKRDRDERLARGEVPPPSLRSLKLTDKQRDDTEKYIPFCVLTAKHYAAKCPAVEFEEFFQAAYLGLADAVKGFDEGLGHEFSTYCYPRMRGSCMDLMRGSWLVHMAREHRGESAPDVRFLSISGRHDDGEGSEVFQIVADEPPPDAATESSDSIDAWFRGFTPEERYIVLAYVVDGMTMKQIGYELGLGQPAICIRFAAIMERLRERALDPRYQFLSDYRQLATA